MLLNTLLIFGLVLLIGVTFVFLIAQLRSDNSIMDIAYGPLFLLSGLATLAILTKSFDHLPSWQAMVILSAIFIWSLRLSSRIYRKNRGQKEDARYAAWREAWSKRGSLYFILRSYLQINLLQGLVITIVSLPLIIALSHPLHDPSLINYLFIGLGIFIFLAGLIIETIADAQLDAFIARKKAGRESATIMPTGLFRYSRRPNYFGESLIWWGIAIIALPLPLSWIAFLSPLTITYIVTQVTGPMLEKIFLERYPKEYGEYMSATSYLIPWPRKSQKMIAK